MVSQCEVICSALHLIDDEGWVQHTEHAPEGWCLTGACSEAVRRLKLPEKETNLMREIVGLHVVAALPTQWQSQGIVAYNDAKGRQKYEILTVLKTAGACNHDKH